MIPHIISQGHHITNLGDADASLCFIESYNGKLNVPRVQRLDGIYYNTRFDFTKQNENILRTYKQANGIIYQSEYGKKLIENFFGIHDNYKVIQNGADLETIEKTPPLNNSTDGDIWSCAASWRPHKRLPENIRYFLEHKKENDILIIAGDTPKIVEDKSIAYVGNLTQVQLYSLYKASKYFIHLGWLDCCPNVVVDALACGAQIICTTSGGTKEVAGESATIIEEEEWDFKPLDLYDPPKLDFTKRSNKVYNCDYDMKSVTLKYLSYLEEFLQ
jgi:glycosyltransferase involved in cell wall biosynthesis